MVKSIREFPLIQVGNGSNLRRLFVVIIILEPFDDLYFWRDPTPQNKAETPTGTRVIWNLGSRINYQIITYLAFSWLCAYILKSQFGVYQALAPRASFLLSAFFISCFDL